MPHPGTGPGPQHQDFLCAWGTGAGDTPEPRLQGAQAFLTRNSAPACSLQPRSGRGRGGPIYPSIHLYVCGISGTGRHELRSETPTHRQFLGTGHVGTGSLPSVIPSTPWQLPQPLHPTAWTWGPPAGGSCRLASLCPPSCTWHLPLVFSFA